MKVQMQLWVGGHKVPSWFENGKVMDITLEHLEDLFAYGLKAMFHRKEIEGKEVTLMWVDNYRFNQR